MKIVEIIVLMGTQCVSPIQHAPLVTEVSKVQCAVVLEKDSETEIVEVSPPAAVNHPAVSEAMTRLSKQSMPAAAAPPAAQPFRIVPAAIARREAEVQVLPREPLQTERVPDSIPEIAAPAPIGQPMGTPQADTIVANLQPPTEASAVVDEATSEAGAEPQAEIKAEKPKKSATSPTARKTKSKSAAKLPDRCTGNATAKWYTNKNGQKKYRCVSASRTAKQSKTSRTTKAQKGLY